MVQKASLGRTHSKQKLMNEIKVHRSLKSIYVCRLLHFFDDEHFIYIILELCTQGSLENLLKTRKRLHTIEVQFYTK